MILESLLSGSVLGIFGSLGGGVLDFLKQRQQNKHEIELINARKGLVEAEGANAVALADAQNFAASHESDKSTYANQAGMTGWLGLLFNFLMATVDFARGITRPGITWTLFLESSLVAIYALLRTNFPDEFWADIAVRCINSLLFLTETSVVWWMGSRAIRYAGQGSRK